MTAYLFTHIPKNAGSWVRRNCIEPNFAPHNMLHAGGSLRQIPELRRQIKERQGQDVAIWGHFNYGFHRLLPVKCRYFTVLRDPIDRVVSYYYFVQETKIADEHHPEKDIAMNMSLLDFSARPSARDVQCRYLAGFQYDRLLARSTSQTLRIACLSAARRHLHKRYDVVGFQHDLPGFARQLSQTYGWECKAESKPTWTTTSRPRVEEIDDATRRELSRLNTADLELYEEAQRKLSTPHSSSSDPIDTPQPMAV